MMRIYRPSKLKRTPECIMISWNKESTLLRISKGKSNHEYDIQYQHRRSGPVLTGKGFRHCWASDTRELDLIKTPVLVSATVNIRYQTLLHWKHGHLAQEEAKITSKPAAEHTNNMALDQHGGTDLFRQYKSDDFYFRFTTPHHQPWIVSGCLNSTVPATSYYCLDSSIY
jgi:hypothetical protein